MKYHPASEIFPMMDTNALTELSNDIKESGLLVPIITHDGMILDGRNRFEACQLAGIKPTFMPFHSDLSPTEWVLSMNAKRRHLTPSQKAAAGVASLPLLEAEAAVRRRATQNNKSDPEIIPEQEKGEAREKAAAIVGVNPRYISDAKKIKEESPETFSKIQNGEISIPQAKREISKTQRFEPFKEAEPVDESNTLWTLKRHWKKASKKEKAEFLNWVQERSLKTKTKKPNSTVKSK